MILPLVALLGQVSGNPVILLQFVFRSSGKLLREIQQLCPAYVFSFLRHKRRERARVRDCAVSILQAYLIKCWGWTCKLCQRIVLVVPQASMLEFGPGNVGF